MGSSGTATAVARGANSLGSWVRVVLVVAVMAGSAGLRGWQRSRVEQALLSGTHSPFPLATIPLRLGSWEGRDDTLDPHVSRATGAVDHVFRTYVDSRTGVRLSVILLYGPPVDMAVHSPENCYPAAGYALVDGPRMRMVSLGDHAVPFRSLTYARGSSGHRDRQHVYYTWRYEDRWTPDQESPKRIERIPGTYKIHIARAAAETERFDLVEPGSDADHKPRWVRDPCQDFLEALLPEIEQRLLPTRAS